jgi:UbiD family decarboxylase
MISTHVPYKGYIHDIGQYIFTFGPAAYYDFLIFVDADVDITDFGAVLREVGTKAHPKKDFHNIEAMKARPEAPKSHLNVYLSPEEKKAGVSMKCYIDATTKEWDEAKYGPKDLSTKTLYPPDLETLLEKVKVKR